MLVFYAQTGAVTSRIEEEGRECEKRGRGGDILISLFLLLICLKMAVARRRRKRTNERKKPDHAFQDAHLPKAFRRRRRRGEEEEEVEEKEEEVA